jgi:hypothetical protein
MSDVPDYLAAVWMPTERERLVDRIGFDFYQIEMQLAVGLQEHLQARNAPPAVVKAAGEFLEGVVKELRELETEVTKLANVPGATEAGYRQRSAYDRMLDLEGSRSVSDQPAKDRGIER